MTSSNVPIISVVGKTNIGKSSTIASLCDLSGGNKPEIRAEAGVTHQKKRFFISLDSRAANALAIFQDTPGFQNSNEILERVREHCQKKRTLSISIETVIGFCEDMISDAQKSGDKKQLEDSEDDWVAWGTIQESHLNLFVIDTRTLPSQNPGTTEALEVLKACGVPIMTVFNYVSEDFSSVASKIEEWKKWLKSQGFHWAVEYDAMVRDYERGIHLLREIHHQPVFNATQKKSLAEAILQRGYMENRRIGQCRDAIARLLLEVASMVELSKNVPNADVKKEMGIVADRFYRQLAEKAMQTEVSLVEVWDFPSSIVQLYGPKDTICTEYLDMLAKKHAKEGRSKATDDKGGATTFENAVAGIAVAVGFTVDLLTGFLTFGGGTILSSAFAAWLVGKANFTVTKNWLKKTSNVGIRAGEHDFQCILARQCAVLAALRKRGQAESDAEVLRVEPQKFPLEKEIQKFLDKNGKIFQTTKNQDKLVDELSNLLEKHCHAMQGV